MLIKWFAFAYKEIKGFYNIYILLLVVGIGLFAFFADYKSLKDKKLKKEYKICRFIGVAYVIGGIGLFIILKIF